MKRRLFRRTSWAVAADTRCNAGLGRRRGALTWLPLLVTLTSLGGDPLPGLPGTDGPADSPVPLDALNGALAAPCADASPIPLELNLGFSARVALAVPEGAPNELVVADLDGDGRLDLVTANAIGHAFRVFRNLIPPGGTPAPGTFAAPLGFGLAGSPARIAVGDVDGDDRLDVIVNPRDAGGIDIYQNRSTAGNLAFDPPVVLPNVAATSGGISTAVAVSDFDGDGQVDVVVANPTDGTLGCFQNTSTSGNLSFAVRLDLPSGAAPARVAIGDIDGDGRPDLAVANQEPPGLTLLRNTSSPDSLSFGAPLTFAAPITLADLVVADLDRDGKRDIAAAAGGLDGVVVWRNTALVGALSAASPRSVAEPLFFPTGCSPRSLAIAELDGDGFPDLAVANFDQDSVSILGNRSEPGRLDFVSRGEFPAGRAPGAIGLADLDGDRRPDLAVAEQGAARLHIRRNRVTQEAAGPISFSVSGVARPTSELIITASSANEGLIPFGNLSILGSGGQRTLVAVPRPGVSGVARVKVRVEDGAGRVVENEIALLVGCTSNTIWTEACELGLARESDGTLHATIQQSLDQAGEGRWYRFRVQPESQLFLILSGLPADYDLFVFQDIRAAYEEFVGSVLQPDDLLGLSARYAPAAYSPAAYSPAAYSPAAYSPAAYSPAAYSPAAYSPMAYSPAAYSPAAYSPAAYSPAAYSPAAYSPAAYSPAAYSPAAYSGPAEAPVAFSPAAYSGAQTRSLLGASAFDGTANEGIYLNTWTSTGDFYVCVRGRDGAFRPAELFRLDVHLVPGACGDVNPAAIPPSNTTATRGPGDGYRTLVVADFGRLSRVVPPTSTGDWAGDLAALETVLGTFIARPEVQGVVVDVGNDAAVAAANAEADRNFDCVFAKNLVARAIREVVERFRIANPALEYIVLLGNDDIIPNFRYPDNAPLGVEQNFVVPVRDSTASQATLRLGYFMSQDAYGAPCEVEQKLTALPLPLLAVGRLLETPREMTGMIEAYLSLPDGRVPQPTASLVTGYEFLADVATAIHLELRAGIGEGDGQVHNALIAPEGLSPQADPATTDNWSAAELAQVLLGRRHDLIFLAGHFNDASALASDYESELRAIEVAESSVDLRHCVVFGAGCHVGYNTVDGHAIPGATQAPDWAQALARKQATLVGGWAYQYGDTELLEYSERLYLNFARQLRRSPPGQGVPVGKALVAAKRQYLEETDDLRGIHEKSLLQVALFGLPMLQVDLPNKRDPDPTLEPLVTSTSSFTSDPGATLGLQWANVTIPTTPLVERARDLGVYDDNGDRVGTVQATYLAGPQGSVSHPGEPVLPLVVVNASAPSSAEVLRGVGFRGGTYADELRIRQLTGTPATEFRGASLLFHSRVFHPVQPWAVNYFGALCPLGPGLTRLNLFPAQYRTDFTEPELGTRRVFSEIQLRLYYSGDTTTYTEPPGENPDTPALADAPTIVSVTDEVVDDQVTVTAVVVGNPSAGIQEVWMTFTAETGPWRGRWQALDLTQQLGLTTHWMGTLTLPAGVAPADVRYAVHAVNGVGLVTMNANRGAFFTPGALESTPTPTRLTLDGFPLEGRYADTATFSAVLATEDGPVAGQLVRFGLGLQQTQVFTDADGRARAQLQLQGLPGAYALQVSFGGTLDFGPSSASTRFEIRRQLTAITLEDVTFVRPNLNVLARLTDLAGRPIAAQTIFFVLTDGSSTVRLARAVTTDYAGRTPLGIVPLEPGRYNLKAHFNDQVPLPASAAGGAQLLGTRNLDPRYEALVQAATYDFSLVAVDATIFRAPGRLAKIEAASLLTASRSLAGALRLESAQAAEPDGASVTVEEGWLLYEPPPGEDGPGQFTYTIADDFGNAATGTVRVLVLSADNNPSMNILSITPNPDGSMTLRFMGIPGLSYRVQARDSLDSAAPWLTLGTAVAGGNGIFQFTDHDAAGHGTRYYRTVGP